MADEVWGLTPNAFLTLYLVLLVLPGALGTLITFAVPAWRQYRAVPDDTPLTGAHHIAYLARGPLRAVETAIAALVERGDLQVVRGGRLRAAAEPPEDALEQVVLETAERPDGATPNELAAAALRSRELAEIRIDLEQRALIRPEFHTHLLWKVVTGAYAAVLLLGVVRWFATVTSDAPIGFLTFLLVVAVGAVFAALAPSQRRPRLRRTELGKQVLRSSRQNIHGAVREVVLNGGLPGYPDHGIRPSIQLRLPRRRRGRVVPVTSSAATMSSIVLAGITMDDLLDSGVAEDEEPE